MTIINYSAGPDGLNVEWQSGETSEFSYFWLRDNARDPVSFDSHSHQRELFTAMVPADIRPEHLQLSADGDSFQIEWPTSWTCPSSLKPTATVLPMIFMPLYV